jgi:NAD-dependent deacetylase
MEKIPVDKLIEYIKKSNEILIFTGAGVSTRSGIADFRGPQGIWKKRTPVFYDEFMSSEEARVEYWNYKLESWDSFKNAVPNEVHISIVDLERAGKLLMVVTQNTDGLHSLAGLSEKRLVEVHGSMRFVECQKCHKLSPPDSHFTYFKKENKAPVCECGGYLKPATISFGQNLKEEDLNLSFSAALNADLVIALGTTLSVTPASLVPLKAAELGIPYVIINRGATDHDSMRFVRLRIDGDVADIFPYAVRSALEDK